MTTIRHGDVLLARFDFPDATGTKLRPVYVASVNRYGESGQMIIVGAITSRRDSGLMGDWNIVDWKTAGLRYPSTATCVLRTINYSLVEHKLGRLSASDLALLESNLRAVLGL